MPTIPSVQPGGKHDTGEVTVTLCPLQAVDVGVKVNTALVPTGMFITVFPDTVPALLVTVPLIALKLTV